MENKAFSTYFEHPYLQMAAGQSPGAVLAKIAMMKLPFGQCYFP